ncbi:MAG: DUF3016 domain-containing protein [Verrucomicrobia bacterium]|nr:DUF3016 domain-containing protein [Verrucomicrobiota bacterium]
MKDSRSLYLIPLMLLAIAASTFASSSSNVIITFVHPERFTDFRAQDWPEQKTATWFANDMTAALAPLVATRAPGCTLTLQFTDIDLGGRVEYRLGPNFRQIRFYHNGREPVRLYFNYTLTDPHGRVLASGAEAATDTLYLGRYPTESTYIRYEEFFFEKQVLLSWIRTKIGVPAVSQTIEENVNLWSS